MLRHGVIAGVIVSALLVATACTYENGSPIATERFALETSAPAPGATKVPRNTAITLTFDEAPAPAQATPVHVRLFSGLIETTGIIRVDLVSRTVRFAPSTLLGGNLRYQVFLHRNLEGINGAQLGKTILFDFKTGPSAAAVTPPAATLVSAADVQKLWGDKGCGACHGAAAPRGGVDLSAAAASVASLRGIQSSHGPTRVVPGDHPRSYLMLKLMGRGPFVGFPMPPAGPRLVKKELRLVADWIDAGAPD